jgi:hypothetical protein
MILPSKHLSQNRALIGVGAEILAHLDEPKAVSELWEQIRGVREAAPNVAPVSFDWFVLALTFLNAIFAIELRDGVIAKTR